MVSPDVIRSFMVLTARHIKAYPGGMVMMKYMQVMYHTEVAKINRTNHKKNKKNGRHSICRTMLYII